MGIGDSLNFGTDQAVQSIKDAAGIVSSQNNNKGTLSPLPWVKSNIKSDFFTAIQIDPSRWDQLFPYRLLVIDVTNNQIVFGNSGGSAGTEPSITFTAGTGTSLVQFVDGGSLWMCQLPITPQQLSIQDQFAIQTTPTLRGILEEHSGVRFKIVNARGTMGVWPQRSSINKPPTTPGIIQSIFGGTIEAAGSVVNQVSKVINSASGNHPANQPVSLRPETSAFGLASTGYYQAIKLQQFLEQYAEAKKNPANASWRLVFDIPKQNQSYIVSPMGYTWEQNVNKPMEIFYNLQLKAWRRIDLKQTPISVSPDNQPISPGILQRILTTISTARTTMSASLNLIGAVRSDIETPLTALRQTALFVKDLAGVAVTVADLPSQIITDYSSSINQSINILASTIKGNVSDPTVTASVNAVQSASSQFEGLSMGAVANGQLGSAAITSQSLNAVNNIYNQPLAQFTLMDQVPVSSLSLTNTQQAVVTNIIATARVTTIAQLEQYRATILQLALQLSNSFGTGSAYYNSLFGLPPPTPRLQPITLDEYDILDSLYQSLACFDILTATTTVDDLSVITSMEYVAGLANTSGIQFEIPSSKILAPVPFGLTIEAISARYLGDPQRWLEIATLNDLRDPYIDENGFQLPLLSNAIGRQIVVGSNVNLFIGQTVILNATGQIPSPRTILEINELSDTSFLLTLSGLADLGNFTTALLAYLQAYLPGTVNSQQKIFIPSDLPVPAESSIIPPSSTSGDPLTGLSKVDWLLTDAGDVAVNNYGDFRYSSGITNLIQALRIKFGTQANTILTHPDFGLNVRVGSISSDIQLQQLYDSINEMIQQDQRFQSVSKLQIILNGPTLGISLTVQLPNQTGVFPISFALTS